MSKIIKILGFLITCHWAEISLARDLTLEEFDIVISKEFNTQEHKDASIFLIKGSRGLDRIQPVSYTDPTLYNFFLELSTKTPLGYFMIGYLYQGGLGIEKNIEKANQFYEKAAKEGSVDAKYILAIEKHQALTDHVVLKKTTIEEAKKLYQEGKRLYLDAANEGHDYAQIMVATMYINGELDTNNYDKANLYLKKALKENEADAYAAMGAMYSDMRDIKKSEKYLKLATDKGSIIAPLILAHNYACGVMVKKDLTMSNKYREIAVKHGAKDYDLDDLNEVKTQENCTRPYEQDGEGFKYTAKDALNDYFTRNKFRIGIIPSVLNQLIKH